MAATYNKPSWLLARVINPITQFAITRFRLGKGSKAVLEVRKRKSGGTQSVPVNVLSLGNERYLVSPRGQTEWVKNARAAGTVRLVTSSRTEEVHLSEVSDAEKPPILRAYFTRWRSEVKNLFAVSGPNAPESEFANIAADHPVFRLREG